MGVLIKRIRDFTRGAIAAGQVCEEYLTEGNVVHWDRDLEHSYARVYSGAIWNELRLYSVSGEIAKCSTEFHCRQQ